MFTYLPQLDGLRAVAVYLVLFFHAWDTGPLGDRVGFADGGFIGVDLFFVLSGFLVSNVILSEVDARGRFSLGGFYARRVRRLLPAAVLVVVATALAFVLVANLVRRLEMVGDARSALLYFANWHFLGQQNDYFSQDLQPSPYLHFWSLAIEEQFYVFFPLLVALLVRSGARLARRLAWALGFLFLASVASQLFWNARGDDNHAYYGTDARLYQLLAGVLLALALRRSTAFFAGRRGGALAVLGLVGLLVVGSSLVDVAPTWRGLAATVAAVAAIGGLTVQGRGIAARVLSAPLPVYLGKISYGTYLWHWPVILVLREVLDVRSYTIAALAFVLSTALAALSYQVFEMPIRTQPFLKRWRWGAVVAGLTVSALAAGFVVSPVLSASRRPALRSQEVTTGTRIPGDGPVPGNIDFKAKLTETGHSKNCAPQDPQACMVVKGNGPLVLVVGDSFANMLGPMFIRLARDKGFSLAQNVVRGCPWPADLADNTQAPADIALCGADRSTWYPSALRALKPALVVLMMRPRDEYAGGQVSSRSGAVPDAPLSRLLYTTMADTVREIRASGAEVLMLQSVVRANPALPLDCLSQSKRLSQCAVTYPRTAPASDGYMQALSAQLPGVWTTSINPVVCPHPPTCLPYLDGQVVFRDKNHITTSFAVANRDKIWSLFQQSGALKALGR